MPRQQHEFVGGGIQCCRRGDRLIATGQYFLNHRRGDILLNIQQVTSITIERVVPKGQSACAVNKLDRYDQGIASTSHAAFEQDCNTELLSPLSCIREHRGRSDR